MCARSAIIVVTWEADMSERARKRMTVHQFLEWQAARDELYELVDGEPVAMAGAKIRHDLVAGNALSEIRRQFRATGNPCDAFSGDIGIPTSAEKFRRPEVSVLCPPFDQDATMGTSPRLIVEVLSESTERVDRLFKLEEYKALKSLGYILVVDPTLVEVGFWVRDDGGMWRSERITDMEAAIEMPRLGLSLPVAVLYDRVQLVHRRQPRLVWDDDPPAPPPSAR
jgi:Uma2 family endonuclease